MYQYILNFIVLMMIIYFRYILYQVRFVWGNLKDNIHFKTFLIYSFLSTVMHADVNGK